MDWTTNNIKMLVPPKAIHRINTIFIKLPVLLLSRLLYRKPHLKIHMGLSWWLSGKESTYQCNILRFRP